MSADTLALILVGVVTAATPLFLAALGTQFTYHAHTLALFTVADLKTIFFPIVHVFSFSPSLGVNAY